MASGRPIVAHENIFNKTVLQENGLYFSSENEIALVIDAVKKETLLFLEHDPYHELISLKETEKGVRMKEQYNLDSYFSSC